MSSGGEHRLEDFVVTDLMGKKLLRTLPAVVIIPAGMNCFSLCLQLACLLSVCFNGMTSSTYLFLYKFLYKNNNSGEHEIRYLNQEPKTKKGNEC